MCHASNLELTRLNNQSHLNSRLKTARNYTLDTHCDSLWKQLIKFHDQHYSDTVWMGEKWLIALSAYFIKNLYKVKCDLTFGFWLMKNYPNLVNDKQKAPIKYQFVHRCALVFSYSSLNPGIHPLTWIFLLTYFAILFPICE